MNFCRDDDCMICSYGEEKRFGSARKPVCCGNRWNSLHIARRSPTLGRIFVVSDWALCGGGGRCDVKDVRGQHCLICHDQVESLSLRQFVHMLCDRPALIAAEDGCCHWSGRIAITIHQRSSLVSQYDLLHDGYAAADAKADDDADIDDDISTKCDQDPIAMSHVQRQMASVNCHRRALWPFHFISDLLALSQT